MAPIEKKVLIAAPIASRSLVLITLAVLGWSVTEFAVSATWKLNPVSGDWNTAAIASMTGPVIARTITQILVGWIPGAGDAVNATTAAGLTKAVG